MDKTLNSGNHDIAPTACTDLEADHRFPAPATTMTSQPCALARGTSTSAAWAAAERPFGPDAHRDPPDRAGSDADIRGKGKSASPASKGE